MIHYLEIRPVIVNRLVFLSDVRDVHRLIDVGDVLVHIDNAGTQDWLADVANVHKIVIPRADVELDVQMARERTAFVNDFGFRRQRRPAAITATKTPRHPSRAPFVAGNPQPAYIGKPDPTSVVISSPAEILI